MNHENAKNTERRFFFWCTIILTGIGSGMLLVALSSTYGFIAIPWRLEIGQNQGFWCFSLAKLGGAITCAGVGCAHLADWFKKGPNKLVAIGWFVFGAVQLLLFFQEMRAPYCPQF